MFKATCILYRFKILIYMDESCRYVLDKQVFLSFTYFFVIIVGWFLHIFFVLTLLKHNSKNVNWYLLHILLNEICQTTTQKQTPRKFNPVIQNCRDISLWWFWIGIFTECVNCWFFTKISLESTCSVVKCSFLFLRYSFFTCSLC